MRKTIARAFLCAVLTASPALAVDAPVYRHAGTNQPAIGVFCLDLAGAYTGCGGGSAVASPGSGGISTFSRMPSSAAGPNLTTAKPSEGRAYTYQGCNTTASTIYMRIYNAAASGAVTVGSTTPFAGPYAFPANTCLPPTTFAAGIGIYASNGLTYAFGTSPADTDATAIGAGALTAFQLGFQ